MKFKLTFLVVALFITATSISQNTINGIITDTTKAPLYFPTLFYMK
ncbi:hypothetical protein [Maribacter sp. 1_MG-2023]|nr:hypothetical protein [Maribacter sp. 1_MG-2023]MDO6471651.1 hypothetical protein [Maribacter sp. 1_MG-2023]